MKDYETITQELAQANPDEARNLFQDALRKCARLALFDMLQAEVNALCGAKYDREASGEARRAGSAKGYAFINGTREEIERPRVRDEQGEVNLKSYAVAKDQIGRAHV